MHALRRGAPEGHKGVSGSDGELRPPALGVNMCYLRKVVEVKAKAEGGRVKCREGDRSKGVGGSPQEELREVPPVVKG